MSLTPWKFVFFHKWKSFLLRMPYYLWRVFVIGLNKEYIAVFMRCEPTLGLSAIATYCFVNKYSLRTWTFSCIRHTKHGKNINNIPWNLQTREYFIISLMTLSESEWLCILFTVHNLRNMKIFLVLRFNLLLFIQLRYL